MKGLRYYAPLLVLAALALAPVWLSLVRTPPPADFNAGKAQLRTVYVLLGGAWLMQMALAGAVVRLAEASPSSQPRALVVGFGGLVHAFVPAVLALATIAIGSIALAIPGVVLFAFLAPIGAYTYRTPAATAFAACLAASRRAWKRVAITVAICLLVDVALVYLAQRFAFPLRSPKPKPDELVAFVYFARIVAGGLVLISPAIAVAISATARETDR